jgi:Sulfotransferase family
MNFVAQYEVFHELAVKATGLDDFGTCEYVEPLKLALSDFDNYTKFSPAGEQMMSSWLIGQLVGRLFAQQGFKSHPNFSNAPVNRPLIIIGMMRTGSTALLRLLAADPANQHLPFWLATMPMPRPVREAWEGNPWYRQAAQGLEQFYQAIPKIKRLHPMQAAEADECHLVLDHSCWSAGLASTARAPEYFEWYKGADARYAYQYYKKVLGLIAGGSTKRWVLKDPPHLWGLDALLDVFPDACIVFTHRDITTSMTSMSSLVYELRRVREPELTSAQHGREMLAFWGQGLDKAERVRNVNDPARFFDIHIDQLQSDPIGMAESIYRYFNMPFTEQSRQALAQHVASDPRAGHGAHHYKTKDFGFTEHDVYANIGEYYERSLSDSYPQALQACKFPGRISLAIPVQPERPFSAAA